MAAHAQLPPEHIAKQPQIDLSQTAGSIKIPGITDSDQVMRRDDATANQKLLVYAIIVVLVAAIAGLVGVIFAFV